MLSHKVRGALFGLSAAALFGASAPVAKTLLGAINPVLLAGLLYLGAAAALWFYRVVGPASEEAKLKRTDVPRLAGVVLAGGLLGPVMMLFGLERVTGVTGALLLNLEAPLTLLLAVAFFGEHLGRYGTLAAVFILGGAVFLKLEPGRLGADTVGVLLLAGASACWALDNNLTQRLSLKDPFAIVRVKTLAAGTVNLVLGLVVSNGKVPATGSVAAALVLGALSYGLSVVLDAYALRLLGAAREAAYFATAPFVGALGAVALLGDRLHASDAAAMGAMAIGVALLLREKHDHRHVHGRIEHEHMHEHDAHHQHGHAPDLRHSHAHLHEELDHAHPHLPDAHHRHEH